MNQRIQKISTLLDEKKAQDIEIFDLTNKDYIVDQVVIATAMAGKHSHSLLDMLKTELKPIGEVFYSTDEESEDWLIADLGDIMIHIFTENHRKKFNLEEFLTQIQKQKFF
ncbi:ribosome silencing factor [Helicobacter sp. 12S02232-10]|uniref:ribosome silencing factor n=1 Tax=Helicobacter sp. 12S02232-10 TaxID=1476197 RepID=UPI000BA7E24E|nr:ribosome silencing factor [Helicobacter sp. 12S02232-10]PAF50010.1 ribosome silencing factor [Helicobacter sp. 12S02232-10]